MIDIGAYAFPDDRFYDGERHLWAMREPDSGCVKVGMDGLGLEALGDLVVISLKPTGTRVRRGEALGTVEAAKMTGEIAAPVSGAIVEHNAAAMQDPHLVNRSPYEAGWLARLEPSDWTADSAALISGPRLAGWLREEVERYRAQGWIESSAGG